MGYNKNLQFSSINRKVYINCSNFYSSLHLFGLRTLPLWLNTHSIGADVAETPSIFFANVLKMGYLFAFIFQNFKGLSSFVKSVSSIDTFKFFLYY